MVKPYPVFRLYLQDCYVYGADMTYVMSACQKIKFFLIEILFSMISSYNRTGIKVFRKFLEKFLNKQVNKQMNK